MTRRPLTYAGGDIALRARMANGRVRVVYLDRFGQPTRHLASAWPHELRGVGWHMKAIREAIAVLPLENNEPPPAASPLPAPSGTAAPHSPQHPRGGGFLFVDHTITEGDR